LIKFSTTEDEKALIILLNHPKLDELMSVGLIKIENHYLK